MQQGRSQGARGPWLPPNPSLTKTKTLVTMIKYLPLRDCFFAGLSVSGLTKEKYIKIFLFALARVVISQWQRSGVDVTSIIVKNESLLVYHFHCGTLCLNLSISAAVKVSAMQNAENVARKV